MSILDKFRHNKQKSIDENINDETTNETLGEVLKKDEEDIDNLQTTTKTSTVNKKVVIILFVAFVITLMLVFTFSSSDSDENNKEPEIKVATNEENYNSSASTNVDKIPDNYDSLAKHENQVNPNNTNQNKTQYVKKRQEPTNVNNNSNYYPENNVETRYSRPAPILQNQYPNYQVQQPINTNKNNEDSISDNKKQDEKNIFSSAISFISFSKNEDKKDTVDNVIPTDNSSSNTFSYAKANNINENTIIAGTLINATLLSGINSQIGGQIIAQINNNVYDSLNGNNLLIPAGSKIIGQYANSFKAGQNRVDISWNSLIFPTGDTYNVENMFKSVDSQGYAGVKGNVNNHTGKQIGAGILASAIGALGNIATGNNYSEYGWRNSGDLAIQGATTSLINTASKIFEKQMNIEPEITINPGTIINIMAINNIVF